VSPSVLERLSQVLVRLLPHSGTCSVFIFGAGSFRKINRKTGNRLRQQLVDKETRARPLPFTSLDAQREACEAFPSAAAKISDVDLDFPPLLVDRVESGLLSRYLVKNERNPPGDFEFGERALTRILFGLGQSLSNEYLLRCS
jgi:hypothetical protein